MKAHYLFLLSILFLLNACTGTRPTNIGIQQGKFIDCPDSPNCVNTQSDQKKAQIEAITFKGDWKETKTKLLKVLEEYPRTTIVKDDGKYLHVEFQSALWKFVDDVEFWIDDKAQQIHFRSASRLGHSDLGANRKRMEKIRAALQG